jgi:uncharacterized Ntn-hydrolase superfamily protein
MNTVSTYSIVAHDPINEEWGVAVHSKYFAVSSIVSWAEANVGALATQASGNPVHWRIAEPLLAKGFAAKDVLAHLIENDSRPDSRQIGIVDKSGGAAAFTGDNCVPQAKHLTGYGYSLQGNYLYPNTLEPMKDEFEKSKNEGRPLCDCLIAALEGAQKAGGDKRGVQAAGLLVVKKNSGYNQANDRYIDLRVDDHLKPLEKLKNLLDIHKIMYGIESESYLCDLDEMREDFVDLLRKYGFLSNDDQDFRKRFRDFLLDYNMENSWEENKNKIDARILEAFCRRLEL